jgi:hypothetical protein
MNRDKELDFSEGGFKNPEGRRGPSAQSKGLSHKEELAG